MDRKKIASIVSAIMNAPLITLATFIPLVLKFGGGNKPLLLITTSVFGCVLPLIMVVLLLKIGVISDFYASDRHERFIPFMATIISYIFGVVCLAYIGAPPAITALMVCYIMNGLVLSVITFKWKISIHASGVTSPITALVYLLGSTMIPLFMLFIPVAWARLELKAHNKLQVTAGALLSSLLTWIQMGIYINVFI